MTDKIKHVKVSFSYRDTPGPGREWMKICTPGLNHHTDFEGAKRLKGDKSDFVLRPTCPICIERMPWVTNAIAADVILSVKEARKPKTSKVKLPTIPFVVIDDDKDSQFLIHLYSEEGKVYQIRCYINPTTNTLVVKKWRCSRPFDLGSWEDIGYCAIPKAAFPSLIKFLQVAKKV